jgi:hypothetical protein
MSEMENASVSSSGIDILIESDRVNILEMETE